MVLRQDFPVLLRLGSQFLGSGELPASASFLNSWDSGVFHHIQIFSCAFNYGLFINRHTIKCTTRKYALRKKG